jgi:hypothetical protein
MSSDTWGTASSMMVKDSNITWVIILRTIQGPFQLWDITVLRLRFEPGWLEWMMSTLSGKREEVPRGR